MLFRPYLLCEGGDLAFSKTKVEWESQAQRPEKQCVGCRFLEICSQIDFLEID